MIFEETTVTLVPGGLPHHWAAMEDFSSDLTAPPRHDRLAALHAKTGRLHVVVSYTVFRPMADRDAFHENARANDVTVEFDDAIRDTVVAHETAFLRPVRVPEMSPMFDFG